MKLSILPLVLLAASPAFHAEPSDDATERAAPDAQIYLTNGFKIGDVSDTSAILWTRTCAVPNGNYVPHDRKNPRHPEQCLPPAGIRDIAPENRPAEVRGRAGFVRFTLTPAPARGGPRSSGWLATGADDDFCVQHAFSGLAPGSEYIVTVEAIPTKEPDWTRQPLTRLAGRFRTAPPENADAPVTAVATSCQYFWDHDDEVRGFKIYDSMSRLRPDFIVQQGDYVYYDRKGIFTTSVPMARAHWHAQNTWPSITEFYKNHPAYFTKDDHDTVFDDANPHSDYTKSCGAFTFAEGVKVWKEQTPAAKTQYRVFRWGKDLQIWLLEGREFRSPNDAPDGPDKSILGREQKAWLERTLGESGATFKVVFSPTAIVGPDFDEGKDDNHSNAAWAHEGAWIRRLLASHGAFVVNGDRHWQYHSIDPVTGLREFSKGPASNQHTIGRVWKQDDFRDEHQYLRVNGGFLSFTVERAQGRPRITFCFYDVDGHKNYSRSYDEHGGIANTFFSGTPDAGTVRQ